MPDESSGGENSPSTFAPATMSQMSNTATPNSDSGSYSSLDSAQASNSNQPGGSSFSSSAGMDSSSSAPSSGPSSGPSM